MTSIYKNIKNINFKNILNLLRSNCVLSLLTMILLFGISIGAFFSNFLDLDTRNTISSIFLTNFQNLINLPFTKTFFSTLSSYFLLILFTFSMGLSAWGNIFIPLIIFMQGFSLGMNSGYLCATYGLRGIFFYMVVLLPSLFIFCVALLLMARESMNFSKKIASFLFLNENFTSEERKKFIKFYFIRSGFILIVITSAAILGSAFNIIFSKFFNF